MNHRRVSVVTVDGVGSVAELPSSVLTAFCQAVLGDWTGICNDAGVALVVGVDILITSQWIVMGRPCADPRGMPNEGDDLSLDGLVEILDCYGADAAVLVAGPWCAIERASHRWIRPVNEIIPMFIVDSGPVRMRTVDPVLWGDQIFMAAHDHEIQLRIPDPVPGFSFRRLAHELDSFAGASHARTDGEQIWCPNLSKLSANPADLCSQLRSLRQGAQNRWTVANRINATVFVPCLERVVQDQLSYGLVGAS